jgi:GT2 family glycosyltransferase
VKICENHPVSKNFPIKIIQNQTNLGLAASLNKGIQKASGDIILIMQGDIYLKGSDSINKIIQPLKNPKIVATNPKYYLPRSIWNRYPFWQKVLFARLVDKKSDHFSNKFDAIRKSTLKNIGLFDNKHYRTAGECQDLKLRLLKKGEIVKVDLEVIHNHPIQKTATLKYFFQKEAQLAEAYGTNTRRHGLESGNLRDIVLLIARPVIALGVLIPFINLLFAPIAVLYSFAYAIPVWRLKDKRKFITPAVNFLSLYIYSIFYLRGFILSKQTL